MAEHPSLMTRIALGKAIGFGIGLVGFLTLPAVYPDADPFLAWGILLWYTTMGGLIGDELREKLKKLLLPPGRQNLPKFVNGNVELNLSYLNPTWVYLCSKYPNRRSAYKALKAAITMT